MATGNQVVPGAPVTAEHMMAAGPPVTAEQAMRAGQPLAAGPWSAGPWSGQLADGQRQPGGQAAAPGQLPPDGQTAPRLWRGSGGRWLVWVFRLVLWAVLLLIGSRGVAAIVTGAPGPGATAATTTGSRGTAFPASLARAYALEFGQVYLSFSPAKAAQRANSLAAFLPPGTDPEFGWNGTGTQTLQSEQVAGVRVLSAHRAVVTLLARVSGNLIELGVPIYAADGGLVVAGHPALLPPPSQVAPPAPARVPEDSAARTSLARMLPAFFRAYASGSALRLRIFEARGDHLAGLGGIVTFGRLSHLSVPSAAGATRQVTVTVVWRAASRLAAASKTHVVSAPAVIDMGYAITVVRHGGAWLVRSISAAATQPWPSP
ncbi:MAG TPA: conjugal transfer protein [Streptosporangiaceae bacterium]|nr:conjugal transfer protein [Streptosporangiaceae bacterium]